MDLKESLDLGRVLLNIIRVSFQQKKFKGHEHIYHVNVP